MVFFLDLSRENYSSHVVKTGFVGYEVILPCTSTVPNVSVTWLHKQKQNPRLYVAGKVNDSYINFVDATLVNKSAGDFTLVLTNVSKNSSGLYLCVEEAGRGLTHAVRVNVSSE